eukprot:scaffold6813_cov123-Isochrysis_galbana.AAC.4
MASARSAERRTAGFMHKSPSMSSVHSAVRHGGRAAKCLTLHHRVRPIGSARRAHQLDNLAEHVLVLPGRVIGVRRDRQQRISASHLGKHAPERPAVHRHTVGCMAEQHLRCAVPEGAHPEGEAPVWCPQAGLAKVGELGTAVFRYEDVLRLQVAVHHPHAHQLRESRGHYADCNDGRGWCAAIPGPLPRGYPAAPPAAGPPPGGVHMCGA